MRLALIFISALCLSARAQSDTCLVVGIADGDTITVRCNTESQKKIRLAGIDAPEKRMAFGQRSKESLSALCYQVQSTIAPKTKDRYGRTVADVKCRGKDAATEQVRTGMAWVYDKYARGYERLYTLQDESKSAGVGLWSDPAPVPPWEWRHR